MRTIGETLLRNSIGFGLVPMAAFGLLTLFLTLTTHMTAANQLLESANTATGQTLDRHLSKNIDALTYAARVLDDEDMATESRVQYHLTSLLRNFPDLLTTLVTNANGQVRAGAPYSIDPRTGRSIWNGSDVRDRAYFHEVRRSGHPILTDAFVGRGYGHDTLVAIGAPVWTTDGQFDGVLQATLALGTIHNWIDQTASQRGFSYVVSDTAHQIIAVGGDDMPGDLLMTMLPSSVVSFPEHDPGLRWRPDPAFGNGPMLISRYQSVHGWSVFLFMPLTKALQPLIGQITLLVAALILVAIIAVLLAHRVSGEVSRNMRELNEAMEDLAHRIQEGESPRQLAWSPPFADSERMVQVFLQVSERLALSFRSIHDEVEEQQRLRQKLNETVNRQEQIIEQRTSELSTTNARLQNAQDFLERAELAGGTGFWQFQPLERTMLLSAGARHLLRYDAESPYMPLSMLMPSLSEEGRSSLESALFAAWRTGTAFRLECDYQSQLLLEPMRLEIAGEASQDPQTGKLRILGTFTDISDRHLAHQHRDRIAARIWALHRLTMRPFEHADALITDLLDFLGTLAHAERLGWIPQLPEQGTIELKMLPDGPQMIGAASLAALTEAARSESETNGTRAHLDIRLIEDQVCLVGRFPRQRPAGTGLVVLFGISLGGELDDLTNSLLVTCLQTLATTLDHVALTQELMQQKQDFELLARSKSELLAGLGHEIRGPLVGVISIADGLADEHFGPVTDTQRKLLHSILLTGRHVADLIGDLLDVAKLEAGRLHLDLQPVELQTIVEQALGIVTEQARTKKLRLSDRSRPLHLITISDPLRVRQMVINLLQNAIKYTEEGGNAWARVFLNRDQTQVCISVCDTGVGIRRDDRADIIRPFSRGSGKVDQPGWGLGLAVVDMLATQLGATMRVHSRPGRGSRFVLSFPLVADTGLSNGGAKEVNKHDRRSQSLAR